MRKLLVVLVGVVGLTLGAGGFTGAASSNSCTCRTSTSGGSEGTKVERDTCRNIASTGTGSSVSSCVSSASTTVRADDVDVDELMDGMSRLADDLEDLFR
jgi:hypothetical protein